MAPKRAKSERSGSAGAVGSKQGEAALSAAELQEQPLRRLFTLLSWENLLQKVNDLGNPKTRKIKELPAFYEVTEVARSVLDSGDELSVDLLAKLVKFQLLDIKNTDTQRRAAVQRAAGLVSSSAKDSAKGEKGKKAAEAPPPCKDTKLTRRGDENTSSYIGMSSQRSKVNDSVYDEVCMRALCHAVQQPLRRLFTLLSWENLLQKVNDLGNPKTRKIKELPAFYEVTEVARSVLDSGDELSVDLLAKLVKFQLLDIKNTDTQRRAAVQRAAGLVSSSAKDSAKGEKGKKAAEAPPPCKDTKLTRRGDENTSSYIDDEPDDGPQHYVLMTGFHQPSLISALDSVGVHVSNVIRLKSDRSQNSHVDQEEERTDTSEEHEFSAGASDRQQELSVFWDQLDGVLNSAGFQSRLSDIARLDYRVDQNLLSRDLTKAEEMQEVGVAMFEGVAYLLYDSLDWRRQHEHYLSRMRLIHIPNISTPVHNIRPDTPAEVLPVRKKADESSESECVDVDMRLYSDLLDRIPPQCISVPLVLHCLIEQVVSSEQEVCSGSAESDSTSDPECDLISYMMWSVSGLPRSEQENSELMEYFGLKEEEQRESKERSPTLLHHHDERSKRLHHIPVSDSLDAVSVEVCVMKKSSVWNTLMSKHLDTSSLNTARRHELLHYCSTDSLSSADVQRLLQLCVFESMPLTAIDESGGHTLAASHTALPWDDPVTFTHTVYCGRDSTHESRVGCDEQQENKVSVEDLQKTLIRHFRHWNFTEHHSAEVFAQYFIPLSAPCENFSEFEMMSLCSCLDQRQKFGCFYAVLSNGLTLAYSHTHQEVDEASPLQLQVSLPTGLQIYFSFQHTAYGQAVLVRQSLPSSGTKLPTTHTESSRTITCDGAVIKHMRDGSTAVLFADGAVSVSPDSGPVCVTIPTSAGQDEDTTTHTQSRDTKVKPSSGVGVERAELKEQVEMTGGSWCTTTPSGVKIRTIRGERVEEKPVLTFYSTDPQTHSVVMTRDDGVLCVLEKHRAVVDHADGTRMTSFYQQSSGQERVRALSHSSVSLLGVSPLPSFPSTPPC
ncbi:hypothetical protein PDJAM_G00236940 [Pangasius djambal]|uniref:Uncharacterized protein n=1 Tax=Pangasius djambal TaxID=1691987 RepID=A0ACC5YGE4_9TELE|nr:hypothetical protein [Pangasius djambal]